MPGHILRMRVTVPAGVFFNVVLCGLRASPADSARIIVRRIPYHMIAMLPCFRLYVKYRRTVFIPTANAEEAQRLQRRTKPSQARTTARRARETARPAALY
jgi:hypothetical protein